jgi:hypothetical protein
MNCSGIDISPKERAGVHYPGPDFKYRFDPQKEELKFKNRIQ